MSSTRIAIQEDTLESIRTITNLTLLFRCRSAASHVWSTTIAKWAFELKHQYRLREFPVSLFLSTITGMDADYLKGNWRSVWIGAAKASGRTVWLFNQYYAASAD